MKLKYDMLSRTGEKTGSGKTARRRSFLCFAAAVLTLSFAGCATHTDLPPATGAPKTAAENSASTEAASPTGNASPGTASPAATADMPYITEFSTPVPENTGAGQYIDALAMPDGLIMSPEEIRADNARMLSECSALCDINDVPQSMTGEELTALITGAKVPALPKYDSTGAEITREELDGILALRNTGAVNGANPVKLGVCVERAGLRSLPSVRSFYDRPDYRYDRLQETEIYAGMPLWVLHTSIDGNWLYVRSYFYGGWILSRSVAVTEDRELWNRFASPDIFAVITEPLAKLGSVYYDMGVKLPMYGAPGPGSDTLPVLIPERDAEGHLTVSRANVPKTICREGFLPYTYRNFIIQAFKYEGMPYGWGGLDNGVDCSSFVASVFRVFGFEFPRNTGEQRVTVGENRDVSSLTDAEKEALLKAWGAAAPSAVYLKTHVMLYLGTADGRLMFIHAPSVGRSVTVSARTPEEIIAVCRIGGQV